MLDVPSLQFTASQDMCHLQYCDCTLSFATYSQDLHGGHLQASPWRVRVKNSLQVI